MKFKFLILCSFSLFFFSCGDVLSPELVKGCTIEDACNYDPEAVIYDGYCVYASDDGEGNYMGNTSDGESTVFDCEGVCLIDSDSDGFCEDFDNCPEDPLNECSGCNGTMTFMLMMDTMIPQFTFKVVNRICIIQQITQVEMI